MNKILVFIFLLLNSALCYPTEFNLSGFTNKDSYVRSFKVKESYNLFSLDSNLSLIYRDTNSGYLYDAVFKTKKHFNDEYSFFSYLNYTDDSILGINETVGLSTGIEYLINDTDTLSLALELDNDKVRGSLCYVINIKSRFLESEIYVKPFIPFNEFKSTSSLMFCVTSNFKIGFSMEYHKFNEFDNYIMQMNTIFNI